MRLYGRIFTALLAAVAFSVAMNGSQTYGNEEEDAAVRARAAEIVKHLPAAPEYGARAMSQDYWALLAELPSGKRTIAEAEKLLDTPFPEITEELYKEFYKNGNRSHYQGVFFNAGGRYKKLAMAECLERKGRFIAKLNEEIAHYCDLPSWVLPAHDKNGLIYDGKALYSDLASTAAGGELAIVLNLLGDKLDPDLVARAKGEIERRVLAPCEEAVAAKSPQQGMWWMRTTNNWNAVCYAGTVAAALNIVDSPERRAYFVAAADYFSETKFLKGFTPDGYCSEGLGYWNYGFGNYIYLGALVRVATNGKVDFLRFPQIRKILDYAPTLEIDKGNYTVFADCQTTARPDATFVGYLSRLKGYGYTEFETRGLGQNFNLNGFIHTTSIGFDKEIVFPEKAPEPKKYEPPIRTEFPDAGVVICRPAADAKGKYFAIAFKGGNNAEMHNHNDVGSYSLILGSNAGDGKTPDVFVSRDPGGETYTARTFSGRRYEGEMLNSFGHPVPRIAGTLQMQGPDSKGIYKAKEFTDAVDRATIDFTSCYRVPTLASATRSFEYRRASGENPGGLEIRDTVAFKEGEKGAFETAMITFENEIAIEEGEDGSVTVRAAGATIKATAQDASGAALKLVPVRSLVGEKDDSVPRKPNRVAFKIDSDVSEATIVQQFSAE